MPAAGKAFSLNHKDTFNIASGIRNIRRRDLSNQLKIYRDKVDVIIGGPLAKDFYLFAHLDLLIMTALGIVYSKNIPLL